MASQGNILLLGNSHADAIKTSFAKSAEDANYNVYFMVGNYPLMPGQGNISAEGVVNEALKKNIKEIIYFTTVLFFPSLLKLKK